MSTPLHSETIISQCLPLRPFGNYIPVFTSFLSSQGFTPASLRSKTQILRNFNHWIGKRHINVCELDEGTIDAFFKQRPRPGYVRRGDFSTLCSLLGWLREIQEVQTLSPEGKNSELHSIERSFSLHLEQERGLSQATLHNYLPVIRCFLTERFGSDDVMLSEINASDVAHFVLRHARTMSCRSAQLMTTALRGFLRFLYFRGDIASDLALSVPTVADWKMSDLPKSLEPEEVERLLQNCDRCTATGQRDYAILILLARLGLRAGEVVAMTLDDISWEAGLVNIRGKGARHDQLPIPQDVGEALATYLRHGRPPCDTRRVFVRARAPRRGFSSSVAIANIVRRALTRAELDPIRKGAHLLRHSLAIKMLQQGACLAEIGEILRHSSQNTTEIYTKVDLVGLSTLALPWPGGDL
ncbi:site-specific integrase [Thermodesulfobacteriota bacterium]